MPRCIQRCTLSTTEGPNKKDQLMSKDMPSRSELKTRQPHALAVIALALLSAAHAHGAEPAGFDAQRLSCPCSDFQNAGELTACLNLHSR